ncbi:hypothetical protein J4E86_003226 [Alternaria arbusti]|uniref:uncharacterized protein n=1 Tax=Alternaria arbusti TaxID=232088 RepID=UPI0022202D60|nr:uncharacterized protein J4E86_003226 [Alternaria arbusti]KAI4959504.1 hypothetical protein J4E86_003226 [Alternaria arbusti]
MDDSDLGYHSEHNLKGRTHEGVQETRLVIGLDYGTTYTGQGKIVDEKVPSVISYSHSNYEWGGALSEDSISMVHTKLELGLQSRQDELDMTLQVLDGMSNLNIDDMLRSMSNDEDVPAYSHKSPEEIVTDYLQKVFQHLEVEVDQFGAIARKHTATDIVVTVPTVSDTNRVALL